MKNEVDTVIDAQKIQAALATDGAELGISPEFRRLRPQFDVHVFESLPSTSTQLWKMLASGAGAGSVAIAQQQSAGRGQRGRTWQSAPGGLYLSLALEPDWPVTYSAQLTCLSAWGIATAFNNLGIPIQIKWPNDLFFKGKKLGGILTETKLAQPAPPSAPSSAPKPQPRIKQAVIGVGINWQNPVPETGITLTGIFASHPELYASNKIDCLEVLAALVLKGMLQGTFFRQQVGSQVFMKAYRTLLIQIGSVVSLDRSLLALATSATPSSTSPVETVPTDRSLTSALADRPFTNCSGEVVGISEEGYLQVAVQGSPSDHSLKDPSGRPQDILLLKPSEIHRE